MEKEEKKVKINPSTKLKIGNYYTFFLNASELQVDGYLISETKEFYKVHEVDEEWVSLVKKSSVVIITEESE